MLHQERHTPQAMHTTSQSECGGEVQGRCCEKTVVNMRGHYYTSQLRTQLNGRDQSTHCGLAQQLLVEARPLTLLECVLLEYPW